MSTAGYVVMGLFFVAFIALLVFVVIRAKSAVKVEDADIPGQVKSIIEKVVPDSLGYMAVPIRSKQSAGSMLKDTLKDVAIGGLTGYRIYRYEPDEQLLLIFGHMQMFFVPVYTDNRSKEIRINLKRTSQVTVQDLIKVKCNGSGSSVKLKFNDKQTFLFGAMSEFFFARATAKEEKMRFAEFINNFQDTVNRK
ncbi:hypothetical protein [Inconstantimicrobium mannanitabidum]|uniref:Uncharacterized protein n=1 Tax=Inconstantimicrobium mannanitabidum TaxID=1604901 RepID=A0ACB5RCL4_9CLOT|nr:hypothetical protein [Clostridium sp. TW13]GKX66624.1 hypothetical protein rsdtw13_18820 [Clostridium sp. TW13]